MFPFFSTGTPQATSYREGVKINIAGNEDKFTLRGQCRVMWERDWTHQKCDNAQTNIWRSLGSQCLVLWNVSIWNGNPKLNLEDIDICFLQESKKNCVPGMRVALHTVRCDTNSLPDMLNFAKAHGLLTLR